MHIKDVTLLPQCFFCQREGETVDALYDAPTIHGSWAYLCEKHLQIHASKMAEGVGTQFRLRETVQSETKAVLDVIEESSIEEIVMGTEMRHVKCPECAFSHPMESDACGEFDCHGCGVKLRMKDPIEMML